MFGQPTRHSNPAGGLNAHWLVDAVATRGRSILQRVRRSARAGTNLTEIIALVSDLVSFRGESVGHHIADDIFKAYRELGEQDRIGFLNLLADGYGPDQAVLRSAISSYNREASGRSIAALRSATDSPRQTLIRRLNLAQDGTHALVRLREDALNHRSVIANFDALDADLSEVITPWFNTGFLELRQIDWTSPANVLHKIISYEAVHEVEGWEDLRRRVEPADRRCFAFFHPRICDEPLIFVEVALTIEAPSNINSVLDEARTPIAAEDARTAVFYSISNCQKGLRGIPFGNTLIKLVVELLSQQLPNLKTFVTLSPLPGFSNWLAHQLKLAAPSFPIEAQRMLLELGADWSRQSDDLATEQILLAAAARYLMQARTPDGKVVDPVARFHLGNGASLERINFAADLSPNGLRQAHGLMVNYLYKRNRIEANARRFAEADEVAASAEVKRLLIG